MTGAHRANASDPGASATGGAAVERTPEELRGELGELRAELGETVEALAHRVDVPARVRARREEATDRVQQQVTQAREVLAQKAPQVENAVRERPAVVGGIALALVVLLVNRLRRRGRTKRINRVG